MKNNSQGVIHNSLLKISTGFTLVETLVAIAILLVAVVGPLSIVSGSVATSNLAKDQVLVQYLAQEGVELVRNKRDSNILASQSNWLTGLENCITAVSGTTCTIDAGTFSVQPCVIGDDACSVLYKNNSGTVQIFGHTGSAATETTFRRLISIVEITSNQEAEISVKIKWKTGSLYGTGPIDRVFEIKDRIFNWSS